MWSFQGPAKKNKKKSCPNCPIHFPPWCPVNPASDATLVLGRDPEMHRSQMDKTKTKQRREGEWCHLTCHSDSSQIVSNSVKGLFFNEAKMAEAKGRSATTACDELPPDRNTNQIRKKESHLLKFRLFEFVSANLQWVSSCPQQPLAPALSSTMVVEWSRSFWCYGFCSGQFQASTIAPAQNKPPIFCDPKKQKMQGKKIGMCLMD